MPHFKYTGDKESMDGVYGYDFSGHRVVDVEEGSLAARKLTGNSHFEAVEATHILVPGPILPDNDGSVVEPVPEAESPDDDFGIFRIKEDGDKYSKPDKVCDSMEEVDAYLAENGINKEDRLILRRSKGESE